MWTWNTFVRMLSNNYTLKRCANEVTLSLRIQGEETLKYRCACRPPCGKVQYSK